MKKNAGIDRVIRRHKLLKKLEDMGFTIPKTALVNGTIDSYYIEEQVLYFMGKYAVNKTEADLKKAQEMRELLIEVREFAQPTALEFDSVPVSKTNTGWTECKDKDFGYIPGIKRGYNIEFEKPNEKNAYASCIYVTGRLEDHYQEALDDYSHVGYLPFEVELSKGYLPTGRAVFRGYGKSCIDVAERECYIENFDVEKFLKDRSLLPCINPDTRASIMENCMPGRVYYHQLIGIPNEYGQTVICQVEHYILKKNGTVFYEAALLDENMESTKHYRTFTDDCLDKTVFLLSEEEVEILKTEQAAKNEAER